MAVIASMLPTEILLVPRYEPALTTTPWKRDTYTDMTDALKLAIKNGCTYILI